MFRAIPQRPLGNLEKFLFSSQLTKSYGTVNLTCLLQHAARPSASYNALETYKIFYVQQFRAALEALVSEHPSLRVAVCEPARATAHFVSVTVDVSQVIRVKIAEFWEPQVQNSLIAAECNEEFDIDDATLPLWRLTVHVHPSRPGECLAVFSVQHVIGDGASLNIFWQDFLKKLNGGEIESSGLKVMAPPFEKRNGPKMTVLDIASLLRQELPKRLLPASWRGPRTWSGDAPAIDTKHDTQVKVAKLQGAAWAKACIQAKKHGVTPHAVLMVSLLKAWAEVYKDERALETVTPINCRHMCEPPVPANEMGNFISTYNPTWRRKEIQKTEFWTLARRYQVLLRADKHEAAKRVFHLDFLTPFPEAYFQFWQDKRKCRMGRSGGLEFSDLGKIGLPTHDKPWTVRETYFCQSAHTLLTAMGVNTITAAGVMHVAFCWQRGVLHDAEPFINAFLSKLSSC